ncbi:MAG: hypothetical protein MUF48_03435 [Pirellulaceae bacterium]|jgi:adenosylhomocysteine nucleosidase|nr:hypothetical protein [Pirellulaceae bacterium]
MWLRWVVSNLLHQMAEDKMHAAVERAKQFVQEARGTTPRQASPQSASPLPTPRIAVLFALGIESGGLFDRATQVVTTHCPAFVERVGLLDGRPVLIAESGVGREAAFRAAEDVIKIHQPRWIVSAGFAGALVDWLPPGHIVMPEVIIDREGQPLEVGLQIDPQVIASTPRLHTGRLVTVDQVVRRRLDKEALATRYGAVACDMETMAVAQVCRRQQVRFLSVRIITDGLDDRLPAEIEHLLDQPSLAGKLGAATRAVFQRPGSLKDMWKLQEVAQRASDRLASFLCGVLPQLDPEA